jgi:hypothetical protein
VATFKLIEILTVAAILLGPILALWTQRLLDRLREKRNRRAGIFFTLMATRAAPLSPGHVQALNSIDLVFNRRRDRDIREARQKLLDHLGAADKTTADWATRILDLKVDLFQRIGKRVGYSYDVDYMKRQIYFPQAHVDSEADLLSIRQTLAKVLTDDGIKVIVQAPAPAAPRSEPKR